MTERVKPSRGAAARRGVGWRRVGFSGGHLRYAVLFLLTLALAAANASRAGAHPHEGAAADSLRESMVASPEAAGLPAPARAVRLSSAATWLPAAAGLALALGRTGRAETAGGIVLGLGMVAGPATGYVYGDCARRGLAGALLRGGLFALAVVAARRVESRDRTSDTSGIRARIERFGGVAAGGAVATLGVAAWDIAQVRERVYLRNEERAVLRLGSACSPSGAPALAMRIRF